MKKVLFAMAIAGMFSFVACNNNAPAEELVDTIVPVDTVVEEVIDTTPVEEVVVEEPVKKATTPKKKATKKDETKPEKVGETASGQTVWRCRICGYEYVGEELPDDFICPICKHPASDFEKVTR